MTEIPEEHESDETKLTGGGNRTPAVSNVTYTSSRHVVLGGILIVLFTFYITAASILCYKERPEEEMIFANVNVKEPKKDMNGRAPIWKKLFENNLICSELEIFMKDMNWNEQGLPYCTNNSANKIVIEIEVDGDADENDPDEKEDNEEDIPVTGAKKNRKNTKNEKNKKEQIKKKSSTAEPIIYLFALVFIYLLIKAASDINQHYKSQSKGDKRLRRCSLQSYAQTHKQDRRASKDTSLSAFKNKHHIMEHRSQSLDRFTEPLTEEIKKKTEILKNLRKYTSTSTEEPIIEAFQTDIPFGNTLNSVSDGNMSPIRRCSVPSLLTSQKQRLGSTTVIIPLNRRGSVISGSNHYGSNPAVIGSLGGSFDSADIQFPENKRRVRMINRH